VELWGVNLTTPSTFTSTTTATATATLRWVRIFIFHTILNTNEIYIFKDIFE